MRFDGKAAIVTGGGGGIGRATVARLVAEGARVAVADLALDAAEATIAGLDDPSRAVAVHVDVADVDSVREAVAEAIDALGRIDVLVNNAGWDRIGPFLDTDPPLWDRLLAINLRGPIAMTHAVLPHMIEHGSGAIVFVASDAGRVGSSGEAVYSAAKGGTIAFAKAVAREVARHGIRLNCVAPGPTDTPMLEEFGEDLRKILDGMIRATPLRRIAQPAEVAAAIAYLASSDAAHVTGQTLSVSGGLTMV
jgi:2-hydroxycyclohexanecarboxyl-CoA dehydrogenase